MRAASPALLAALLVAAAALGGCKTVDDKGKADAEDPRDRCLRSFMACAPPARFRSNTDVAALDLRKLVQISSRIDLGGLSERAAKRLRKLAIEASPEALLEIEAAIEDSDSLLGKCRCDEVKAELEKKQIREILASRIPPKIERSPDTWTERIVARLAAIRELTRLSALLALAPDGGHPQEASEKASNAERELCETVLAARAILAPAAYDAMLEAVYQRREADAGAGSAESARRAVGAYARSPSCAPDPPPAK
jgi:hypothetical protein